MKTSSLLFVLVLFIGMVALWGCPKKAEITATPEEQKEEVVSAPEPDMTAEEERRAAEAEARERAAAAAAGLQPVYFDYDKSLLREDARSVMKANAEWLRANPGVNVRLEGNTDERGTNEYNQALGQRRAASARKYLTDIGISAGRMSLLSYGEEKQACEESSEECWQRNRRVDLVAQ